MATMDPAVTPIITDETQNSTTPVTQQIWQTAQDASQVVIGWAFWGTLPIPETNKKISDTMPAFSFDEDDFNTDENNATISPTPDTIQDPFAWGINSLENPEWTISLDSLEEDKWEIIENTSTEEVSSIENDSFELPIENDTTEETTESTPPVDTENTSTLTFDIPTETVAQEITTETVNNNDTLPEVNFDLPVENNTTEELSEETFSIPTEENINQDSIVENNNSQTDISETTAETTVPSFDFPADDSESEIDNTQSQEVEEEVKIEEPEEAIVNDNINEERDNKKHPLHEDFESFYSSLTQYISFKNQKSIQLVGLRTDEDEILYTFEQHEDDSISITKSKRRSNIWSVTWRQNILLDLSVSCISR